MATQNLEVTSENVLSALIEMPQKDFEKIVKEATEQRTNEQKRKTISAAEADLLDKINNIFPSAKRRRYNELYAKFKENDLAEGEYEELAELTNEFEILNAQRLEYIGELASLRGQTLEQVMEAFEITNSGESK
jgi:hypothetical protein